MFSRLSTENYAFVGNKRSAFKYIPLSRRDPKTYLSLGFNLRERFEVDHSPLFGTVSGLKGEWLLSRLEFMPIFGSASTSGFRSTPSAFIPGKKVLAPPIEIDSTSNNSSSE